jgi:WD40 repeat protein
MLTGTTNRISVAGRHGSEVDFDNIQFWNLEGVEIKAQADDIQEVDTSNLMYKKQVFLEGITSLDWSDHTHLTYYLLGVAGETGQVAVLPAITGVELPNQQRIGSQVRLVDWQPEGGGNWLATGRKNGLITIFGDPGGGNTWDHDDLASNGAITALRFGTEDQSQIAAGTNEGYLGVWFNATPDWKYLITRFNLSSEPIYSIDWNQDDTQLLTASGGDGIQIWNTSTWGRLLKLSRDCRSAAWSPDGTHIALEDRTSGTSALEVARSGATRARVELITLVNKVIWSPDGKMIATAGQDGVIRLWNGIDANGEINSLTQLFTITQSSEISDIIWSSNGDMIISGDVNGYIWAWQVP